MRTVLDTPRLAYHRKGYWTVTVGGIPCGTVYQRDTRMHAVTTHGPTGIFDTKEAAADWLAQQEVGR